MCFVLLPTLKRGKRMGQLRVFISFCILFLSFSLKFTNLKSGTCTYPMKLEDDTFDRSADICFCTVQTVDIPAAELRKPAIVMSDLMSPLILFRG